MAESINNKYIDWSANANIKFLHGTQESLNTLINNKTAAEGAFYLTSDTHRLYVGRKVTGGVIPAPVNQGVTTVSAVSDLPNTANVGDFYYVSNDNILAVCAGTSGSGSSRTCQWVQLNTNTAISSYTQTSSWNSNTNTATMETEIIESTGGNYTVDWKAIASDNIKITLNTSTNALTFQAADTTYTIGTAANGTATDSAYITLASSNNLNSSQNSTQQVKITGENIRVTQGTGSEIVLHGIDDIAATNKTTGNGGWEIALKNSNTEIDSVTISPEIAYGDSGATSARFLNNKATLDVYTKAETASLITSRIGEELRNIDAMTFCGTVGSTSDVTAINGSTGAGFHNGDVYKVTSDFTYTGNITYDGNANLRVGDLIIASGTEDSTTGKITSNLQLYFIPSGDEESLTAELTAASNQVQLLQGGSTELVGFQLTAGTNMSISTVISNGSHATMTIAHAAVNRSNTAGNALGTSTSGWTNYYQQSTGRVEFYAPTADASGNFGITTDAQGHITNVAMSKVTINDTHNKLSSVTNKFGTTAVDNAASVTLTQSFNDTDGNTTNGTVTFTSDTLKYTAAANSNSLAIELQWGSF